MKLNSFFEESLFIISFLSGMAMLFCMALPVIAILSRSYGDTERALLPIILLFAISNLICGLFALNFARSETKRLIKLSIKIPWTFIGLIILAIVTTTGTLTTYEWLMQRLGGF